MVKLGNINNSQLLIENNHLNFYNIDYDDNSLAEFVNKNKLSFCSKLVTTIEYTQEMTNKQKNMLIECFPNINKFNYTNISIKLFK
jgi:hypothetical protein